MADAGLTDTAIVIFVAALVIALVFAAAEWGWFE
jgi:hypothetical protein